LVSVGLYILVDHGFVAEIIGSVLYESASYVLVVSGAIVIFVSFLGCWSTSREFKCGLITFVVILILLFLGMFAGAVMSLVFKSSAMSMAKSTMQFSLKNHYGRFKIATDAWNATQDKLRCCGVENEGWLEYHDSYWDRLTNADVRDRNRKLPTWNPFYRFVPQSCCLKLMNPILKWIPSTDFRNLPRCQHWQFGPPTHKTGAFNDAIYYRGCFDAGMEFLGDHSKYLSGIGLTLSFVLLAGIILSFIIIIRMKPEKQRRYQQAPTKDVR